MTNATTPNQTYVDEKGDKQQKEKISHEELIVAENDIVHYYGSEDEVEDDQGEEEGMEQSQPPIAANSSDIHLNKFLKLPKGCKRGTRVSRNEPLIDYLQSQLLTSDEHLSSLEGIASRKERIRQERVET